MVIIGVSSVKWIPKNTNYILRGHFKKVTRSSDDDDDEDFWVLFV